MRGFVDLAFPPQVIIEGILNIIFMQPKEYVNTGRIDVRVNHADAQPF